MRQPLLAGWLMKGRSNFLDRVADGVFLLCCQQAAGHVVKGLPDKAVAGFTNTLAI